MAGEDINTLKSALGVSTDVELARKLGIERSTVAQWKRRGSVPSKYAYLISLAEFPSEAERNLNAVRHHLLGRSERQWFLKAALAFLPYFKDAWLEDEPATRGEERERVVISLMSLAEACCLKYLDLDYPTGDEDYEQLVRIMNSSERLSVDALLSPLLKASADRVLNEGPQ
jgi:transcriptional regulator with XRE-family HTH domain